MRGVVTVMLAGVLGGCVTQSETVHLENDEGETVRCGPYSATRYDGLLSNRADREFVRAQLRDCVGDYERQGYRRVERTGHGESGSRDP